jgi:hypothetical protein
MVPTRGIESLLRTLEGVGLKAHKKISPAGALGSTDRGSGRMRGLVVVPTSADGVTQGAHRPEHETNQQENHANRPQDLERQYESDYQKYQTEDNHCLFPLFSERSARPFGTSTLH